MGKKYAAIYSKSFISKRRYQDNSIEDLRSEIDKQWKKFISTDLPDMSNIFQKELPKIKLENPNGNI